MILPDTCKGAYNMWTPRDFMYREKPILHPKKSFTGERMSFWKIRSIIACILLPALTMNVRAVEEDTDSLKLKLRHFGLGSYEFGQIVKGQYSHASQSLDHFWMQKARLRAGIEADHGNALSVILAAEGVLHFPYVLPGDSVEYEHYQARTSWNLHYALGRISLGNPEFPYLRIGMGFFPFKYNRDAHNFGDYLFRMSVYPAYMPTSFDRAFQHLVGFHLTSWLAEAFRQDLMLTSEMHLWPLQDFSIAYLLNYTIYECVDIGAGVMGYHIFSVDKSRTTPPEEPSNPNQFTFRGVKVMAKLVFDFKRFMPQGTFGSEDLRLYGELCINGIEDYRVADPLNPFYPGYNDVTRRMPLVVGFNVPVFNFLDRLSIEVERWENEFANAYTGVYFGGDTPPPEPVNYDKSGHTGRRGTPWYWSLLAQKTVLEHLKFKLQFARDHTVITTARTGRSSADPQEAMDGLGDWSWMCKVAYDF